MKVFVFSYVDAARQCLQHLEVTAEFVHDVQDGSAVHHKSGADVDAEVSDGGNSNSTVPLESSRNMAEALFEPFREKIKV